jgi:hypothetical protein
MENCEHGNLNNLINNIGSVPENVLKEITIKSIKVLEYFHVKTKMAYHTICPNNLFFDKKNNIKVKFNITYSLQLI